MAHIKILAVHSVNSIINGALRGETRTSSRRFFTSAMSYGFAVHSTCTLLRLRRASLCRSAKFIG